MGGRVQRRSHRGAGRRVGLGKNEVRLSGPSREGPQERNAARPAPRGKSKLLVSYLRLLSVFFFIGAVLHFGDLFGLRLQSRLGMSPDVTFSELPAHHQAATVILAVCDAFAAVGLWRIAWWGVALFLALAAGELVAFWGFPQAFGPDLLHLVVFHLAAIGIYFAIVIWDRLRKPVI